MRSLANGNGSTASRRPCCLLGLSHLPFQSKSTSTQSNYIVESGLAMSIQRGSGFISRLLQDWQGGGGEGFPCIRELPPLAPPSDASPGLRRLGAAARADTKRGAPPFPCVIAARPSGKISDCVLASRGCGRHAPDASERVLKLSDPEPCSPPLTSFSHARLRAVAAHPRHTRNPAEGRGFQTAHLGVSLD